MQVVVSNEKPNTRSKIPRFWTHAKFTLASRGASAESWCVRHSVSKVNEKPSTRSKILAPAKKNGKKEKIRKTQKLLKN